MIFWVDIDHDNKTTHHLLRQMMCSLGIMVNDCLAYPKIFLFGLIKIARNVMIHVLYFYQKQMDIIFQANFISSAGLSMN